MKSHEFNTWRDTRQKSFAQVTKIPRVHNAVATQIKQTDKHRRYDNI